MTPALSVTRRDILNQAWPIIIGQALVPTVGLIDVAIIGRTGDAIALAGVALGATVVTLLFWAFGFLRMGMTGLTSQAEGAGQRLEVNLLLIRGLMTGAGLGLFILIVHPLILPSLMALMAAPIAVEREAIHFATARMAGAPAALAIFAINGWLIGLGRTRAALILQLIMNGSNIAFDMVLVIGFDLGPTGVGVGTAMAEWVTLISGLCLTWHVVQQSPPALKGISRAMLLDSIALRRLFMVNADIMIRTLSLLSLFTWFAHAGARQGAQSLAANHLLMQFVSLGAFVLDAFAFTAEARVGAAIGARSRHIYRRSIRLAGEFTLLTGAGFSLLFFVAGGPLIYFMTTDEGTRAAALAMLPYAAMIPLIGGPSWLLDGIFIGATETRALRQSAIIVLALYLCADWLLRPLGNLGVWLALLSSYASRAGLLMVFLPALHRHHGLIGKGDAPIFHPWKKSN